MIKYIVVVCLVGLAIIAGILFYPSKEIKVCDSVSIVNGYTGEPVCYEGPVRPTDDEEHFRRTGETIRKEVKE